MDAAFEQQVRERAYEIWETTGKNCGSAEHHWLSAEQALLSEVEQVCAKSVTPAKSAQPAKIVKKTAPSAAKAAKRSDSSKAPVTKAAAPRKSAAKSEISASL